VIGLNDNARIARHVAALVLSLLFVQLAEYATDQTTLGRLRADFSRRQRRYNEAANAKSSSGTSTVRTLAKNGVAVRDDPGRRTEDAHRLVFCSAGTA